MFKIVSSILKVLMTLSAIMVVALIIGGVLVYMDANDFRQHAGDYKALLKDENSVLAGIVVKDGKSTAVESPEMYSEDIKSESYPAVVGDSYKLIITDINAAEELNANGFDVNGESIGKNFAIQVLRSDNAAKLMPKYANSADAKAAVFEPVLREIMKPANFFSQYKKGNIIAYPETAMFKAIKFIPTGIISRVAGNAINAAKEKIGMQK